MPPLPELPPTPQTKLYSPEVLAAGLEKFEREGFWLLLSLQHYGWRAHADLAALLVGDVDPFELGDSKAPMMKRTPASPPCLVLLKVVAVGLNRESNRTRVREAGGCPVSRSGLGCG